MPDKFGNYTSEELEAILLARSKRARAGAYWKKDEIVKLENTYRAGATVKDLADVHERTQLAIETMLSKLGLI